MFNWALGWDDKDNNNGATEQEIIDILAKARTLGRGDAGLLDALSSQSSLITIEKGIHPPGPHIRVFYSGGTWHVNLVGTAAGGRAGYRVGDVQQFK